MLEQNWLPPKFYDDYPIVPLTVDNGVTIPMTVRYPTTYISPQLKKWLERAALRPVTNGSENENRTKKQ